MPRVYKFRLYSISQDDFVTSTRMATKKKIKELGAEIVPGAEAKVDGDVLKDGLTEKYFRPKEE